MANLKLKSTITKMKQLFDGLNIRSEIKRISTLENKLIEIIQYEEQSKNCLKQINRASEICGTKTNITM